MKDPGDVMYATVVKALERIHALNKVLINIAWGVDTLEEARDEARHVLEESWRIVDD